MCHVIRFPLERRIGQNVAQIEPAKVHDFGAYAPIVSLYNTRPLWPPPDMLAPDTDTDGYPCDAEPA